ncbi:MAG: glycosyltransferase [Bacteriovoracaceae bacterium]|nr:glycosyltransferase [Bacteriovoracaceae bacterium]
MNQKPYIVIAFPCYNEEENVHPLLEQFIRLNKFYRELFHTKVILIDDASTDKTLDRAKEYLDKMDIEIVEHGTNRGLTGGINTAFNEFYKYLDYDNVPFAFGLLDGDNSHNPMTIPAMVEKIFTDYDVVVASRYQSGSRIAGVAWYRKILSFGLAVLFKLMKNIPGVWDYSCGFRLYSPQIVKKLRANYGEILVEEKSFASMVEILVKCHLLGAVCSEVPFFLRYDLKLGESKMPFMKTISGNLKLLRTLNVKK